MSDTTENPTPEAEQEQPAAEQPETQPVTAETEVSAETQPAPEAAEGDEPEEQPEAAEEKRRRQGGFQRKLERERRENEALRARLAELEKGQPAKERTPAEQADEYIAQKVEERLAAREAERQQRAQAEEFARRAAEAKAAHPDFEEVIEAASDMPVSQTMTEAILHSARGPEIMYLLAKSPAELARISALPPLQQVMEIARLEAKASASATPTKAASKPLPKKPATPAPITPVTARGPSNVKSPEEMTYEEYAKWRSSQTKR